jgi:hypothetical protein
MEGFVEDVLARKEIAKRNLDRMMDEAFERVEEAVIAARKR